MVWMEADFRQRWPWHRRLVSRYAGTLATVALGSTLLVGVPLYLLAAQLLRESLEDRLEGEAELAALEVRLDQGPDGLKEQLATLGEEADLDAMYLVTSSGVISVGPSDLRLTAVDQEALARAVNADASTTPIQFDIKQLPFLTAYAPTADAGVFLGVRASAPYLERLDDLRSLFAVAALAWGALVALLGGLFGARLTRPIERLLAATERLAAGGAPAPPEPGGSAELDTLQEAFAAMAASVRQREQGLRALAGSVAHEVRNPSHALRLHLGLLRRDLGTDPSATVVARMATLERELDLLDATVDGFLVFARDRAAQRQTVSLRTLLGAVDAPVEAPEEQVWVDPLLVGRAVANLVRNAREAGGEPVQVRARVEGKVLRIEVEDQGPGFSASVRDRAFEPFVTGRSDGSGLGLAVVAAVAAAHGGEARVMVSQPGKTVVALILPLV